MSVHDHSRFRGFATVRADGSNPTALVAQIQQAFAEFRTKNDERLNALERGREDAVTNEHVERINTTITELTTALNTQQETIAALRVAAGGGGNVLSEEARAHTDAFGSWFRRGNAEAGLRDLEVRAGLTTQSDPDGGYVVPEQMEQTISRVLSTVSAIRGLARVLQISGGSYTALVSQGGAGSGWVGEESTRPETSTARLSEIRIEFGEMYANPACTQRLLDDGSIDIAAWLAEEVSITFAEQEGAAFVIGDGKNKPRGFLSYPQVANSAYAWGKLGFVTSGGAAGFAAASPTDALVDLYYGLKAGYRNGASFVTSDATLGQIRKFKDGMGNYIWAPPTVGDQPGTILGKPVVTDDNMPQLAANAFPVAFGNFQRGYQIIDKLGTRILRDPYTNKPNVMFYTTKRVGGGVINFEAIKLLKIAA